MRQAVRWEFSPAGRDAAGRLRYTGLTTADPREAWFTLPRAPDSGHRDILARWLGCYTHRRRELPAGEDAGPGNTGTTGPGTTGTLSTARPQTWRSACRRPPSTTR